MDKLSGLASKLGGNKESGSSNQGGSGQKEDYLDKALDAGEKKFGINLSREQNEKITDAAREQFEKQTGKNVPDKVSN